MLQKVQNEHASRFSKEDQKNYYEADLKVLLTIGDERSVTKSLLESIDNVPGVAVVGMIVSQAHNSFNMLIRDADSTAINGPLFLHCDSVSRTIGKSKSHPQAVQSYKRLKTG